MDRTKPGFHEGRQKHTWRTPCCTKEWSYSKDIHRCLFVVGANPASTTFALAKCAYICSTHHNDVKLANTIEFLRGMPSRKGHGQYGVYG